MALLGRGLAKQYSWSKLHYISCSVVSCSSASTPVDHRQTKSTPEADSSRHDGCIPLVFSTLATKDRSILRKPAGIRLG